MRVFACFLLAACEPTIANRGNILDPEKLSEIKSRREHQGGCSLSSWHSNGEQVLLTTRPGITSGARRSNILFSIPKVMKQQAIEICFDDKGVVTSMTNLDLASAQDITPSTAAPRLTATTIRHPAIARQSQSPVPDMGKKQEGQ